jgi:hypothetical protein
MQVSGEQQYWHGPRTAGDPGNAPAGAAAGRAQDAALSALLYTTY